MNVFPLYGTIDETVASLINSRAGNNVESSKLMSWIRVSSGAGSGLVIQSVRPSTFEEMYGGTSKSGMVGVDFSNQPVYADTSERSLRPSPIIESAEIGCGSYGLSRKATISIKCFTLGQVEKVTQYFLEPGYYVLVDFGWNTSSGVNATQTVSVCEMVNFNSYSHIYDKREKSGGTYDGFLGKITGGGISVNSDGSYTVECKLITIGEIPAYLQTHKNAIDPNSTDQDTTGKTFGLEDLESAADDKNTDFLVFAQMYNGLPDEKRFEELKKLRFRRDKYGNRMGKEYQFVNMDEVIRKIYAEDYNELKTSGLRFNLNFPDGVNLIVDQAYIRMEVAIAIINEYEFETKPNDSGCGGSKTYSYRIDCSDVIISGHKHMFSTNAERLFIPNPNTPDFGLYDIVNANPTDIEIKLNGQNDCNPWKNSGVKNQKDYAFPSQVNLSADSHYQSATSAYKLKNVITNDHDAHSWGYLENLYVNYNFFVSTLEKKNFVAKDVLYELLNGMSEACNSVWNFEIKESPDTSKENPGGFKLTVIDTNLAGKLKKSQTPTVFDACGTKSPFLSFDIEMDIPGIMASQIMAQQASAEVQVEGQSEQMKEKAKPFFGGPEDNVSKKLTTLRKKKGGNNDEDYGYKGKSAKEADAATAQQNLLIKWANNGLLVPLNQNRDDNKGNNFFQKWIGNEKAVAFSGDDWCVGIWGDQLLLKKLELGLLPNNNWNPEVRGPRMLPVKVNFEILGVSGLRVGDLFTLTNAPKGVTEVPFQIMEITHSLSENLWITKVKAMQRRNVA